MKLYDCKLRLAGNVNHEVMKSAVTAAEIEILRAIHGPDAVLDIKPAGENTRTSAQERVRLKSLYAGEDNFSPQSLGKRLAMLRDLFGHDKLPLPDEPSDPSLAEDAGDDEMIEAAPPPVVRTRVKKPEASFAE